MFIFRMCHRIFSVEIFMKHLEGHMFYSGKICPQCNEWMKGKGAVCYDCRQLNDNRKRREKREKPA